LVHRRGVLLLPRKHSTLERWIVALISRGFRGRRPESASKDRLPPGQYETRDFPVLSAGPTPRTPLSQWALTLRAADGGAATWNWGEFEALPRTQLKTDIHCVTKWSKFDTSWEGVSIDTLLDEAARRGVESAPFVMAISDGGYTTNVPLVDLTGGKAMVAFIYDGKPLDPEHGGPARLLVPHLYFWKSAKWIRELRFMTNDRAGFWESVGYHIYGDPWREQRYTGDP
jgi:DMSO/TMAO reductase YedYZ molybdopterin-dependent catalytic subunit